MANEIEFWQQAYMNAKTRDMALLCFGAYAALILAADAIRALAHPSQHQEAPHG